MWRAEREGWLLEVAVSDSRVASAWVSSPNREVRGYGTCYGTGWDEITTAVETALAQAPEAPFAVADLVAVRCLRCSRPCAYHGKYTAADVNETWGATYERPAVVCGRRYFSPLSPSVVGQFIGHDPLPFLASES